MNIRRWVVVCGLAFVASLSAHANRDLPGLVMKHAIDAIIAVKDGALYLNPEKLVIDEKGICLICDDEEQSIFLPAVYSGKEGLYILSKEPYGWWCWKCGRGNKPLNDRCVYCGESRWEDCFQ